MNGQPGPTSDWASGPLTRGHPTAFQLPGRMHNLPTLPGTGHWAVGRPWSCACLTSFSSIPEEVYQVLFVVVRLPRHLASYPARSHREVLLLPSTGPLSTSTGGRETPVLAFINRDGNTQPVANCTPQTNEPWRASRACKAYPVHGTAAQQHNDTTIQLRVTVPKPNKPHRPAYRTQSALRCCWISFASRLVADPSSGPPLLLCSAKTTCSAAICVPVIPASIHASTLDPISERGYHRARTHSYSSKPAL